ncbi:MAG: 5-formyltetrahydrofolate cyclo-ligase [Chthoniobacter sp.]|nr:5-formyltetrahydrofolate cyclo-ligase [Chthoniobacter sp.]
MSKTELRRTARQRLVQITEREEKSRAIVSTVMALPQYAAAVRVALFAPLPSEPMIELLWAEAPRQFCYPRVQGDDLLLLDVAHPWEVQETPWHPQVREPALRPERVIPIADVDVVLVPGLAFTRDGNRLGRGRGFYDRLLAGKTARTQLVGVCFAEQLFEELPCEAHDARMDLVITELGG